MLAGVYQLTDFYVACQQDAALVWLVADRAREQAEAADDPYMIACSAWGMVQALRDSGRRDEALSLIDSGTTLLAPYVELDETPDDWRGITGALHAEGALAHSRRGRYGDAWSAWDRADGWARKLGRRSVTTATHATCCSRCGRRHQPVWRATYASCASVAA
ncbi:hypothetical protein ACFVAV_16985 [Nocardia sp. NPDC057663]|uniref:hypothetical protein n=1 Tax=Nocardia sp. NPDC057663 TaxID=3346201 RepID=UPI0036708892